MTVRPNIAAYGAPTTVENADVTIVGGAGHVGVPLVLALAEAGARLILVSRDRPLLDQTAEAVGALGSKAVTFQTDVTDEKQVLELEGAVKRDFGKLQILVNNAGMNIRKPATEFTLQEWRLVLDTNLTSAFLFCRSFVPLMKGQGYGRILNLTSIMSHVSLPGRTAYSPRDSDFERPAERPN